MKPFATVLDAGTSTTNHTGSWRTERPRYVHRLPPCNNACPAGENIQEWLSLVEREQYEDAWREMVKNNPFPATMGRICYHPCEKACNRVTMDSAVGINSVERYIGDMALEKKWAFEKPKAQSGKKVLVVGAGPAGLSAAYQLALMGHKVTVTDTMEKAGGTMRYGIPQYRLPRDVLDGEIKRIEALGVVFDLGAKPAQLARLRDSKAYDAIFVATGTPLAKSVEIETSGNARVLDAIAVLKDMETAQKPKLGKRVVVFGGGNTAIDAARTARRLGSEDVTIVYRRTREKMPAHAAEIDEALDEGVKLKTLSVISKIDGETLTLETMALDDKGAPQPTGKKETLKADCVILAVGQETDAAPFEGLDGVAFQNGSLKVDPRMMTGTDGIFAGGDLVASQRTATTAIGQGRKAARSIDAWLKGAELAVATKNDIATPDRLNKWYYAEAKRAERTCVASERRVATFGEVQQGLSSDDALAEARRCLSCGNCFECDNCYSVCPDNAIKKL
ncbi:MAG: NAD(P)-binding protein, partial [Alphaproteobacteria bacterium]|nr:NAD(P)-binding protein [Alphaproteobacteria bacterium]